MHDETDRINGTAETERSAFETPEEPVNGRLMERGEKRVPVSEAVKYRKRAQDAERACEELEGSLTELRTALDESRSMLLASERRRAVDEALVGLRPTDLETARVMLEGSLDGDADEARIREAAAELSRRKPFLFRKPSTPKGGSMGGRPRQRAGALETHARAASTTGDRKALMRYLRVRREGGSA